VVESDGRFGRVERRSWEGWEPGWNRRPRGSTHTHAPCELSGTSCLLSSKVWCCLEVRVENGCETGGELFIID